LDLQVGRHLLEMLGGKVTAVVGIQDLGNAADMSGGLGLPPDRLPQGQGGLQGRGLPKEQIKAGHDLMPNSAEDYSLVVFFCALFCSPFVFRYADRSRGSLQLIIERRQRHPTPQRQFQVGRIVCRKILRACYTQHIAPCVRCRFFVDRNW
jgi:hypothetical protein